MIDWRRITFEQLELLSSTEQQEDYEKNVPQVDITKELVEGWFSDVYHPHDAEFRGFFSDEELKRLEQFNTFFDGILKLLPPSNGTIQSWLASPAWGELQIAAQTLQARLEPVSGLRPIRRRQVSA